MLFLRHILTIKIRTGMYVYVRIFIIFVFQKGFPLVGFEAMLQCALTTAKHSAVQVQKQPSSW